MDPIVTKMFQSVPFAGMGTTLERNALVGVIRNLISESKYTVDYILDYAESVGYSRQDAEDVFKELTGLSPKLIVNNNEYYSMPSYIPNMCIAWGISKSTKDKAFYIVPFEYGYSVMEKDEVNAPISTVICATIPEALEELKKVAKNIQTLDKIITKKLLETENVPTIADNPHQVNLPYSASPLQILKKNFKDKVLSVSEFEKQASKLLASEEITVDEAEDLMAWKQDLIDEDETYGNDVLELNEQWNEVQATLDFKDVYNEVLEMAAEDKDSLGTENTAETMYNLHANLFKNVDLIEAAIRLYQLLLGFTEDEILGRSKFEKKSFHDLETLKHIVKNMKDEGKDRDQAIVYMQGKVQPEEISEVLEYAGFNEKQASKKVKSKQLIVNVYDIDWDIDEDFTGEHASDELPDYWNSIKINVEDENDDNEIEDEISNFLSNEFGFEVNGFHFTKQASKKVTAENMTLDDIEAEDNKDEVQEEIEKIEETPAEEIFEEKTPEQYFDETLQEDRVDTINDVVSKCIDKFSEKFKDFNKYTIKILSYNTKVLGEYTPVKEEIVKDNEINANAILQVILSIVNNADEANIKKALAVFSITNGKLHWTGTVRGENDQVVAFTEEGLDALFEVEELSEEELEDII